MVYMTLSTRERELYRELALRRIMQNIVSLGGGEEVRKIMITRALMLARKYKKRPRSLVQLAVASIIVASRELGIVLDTCELMKRACGLGYSEISLSLVNRLAYELGNPLSLKKHHRDITRRVLHKLVTSVKELNPEEKITLLRRAIRICELAQLTGFPPSTRALLAFLIALRELNLKVELNARKLAQKVGCSEITVYKMFKRAKEIRDT